MRTDEIGPKAGQMGEATAQVELDSLLMEGLVEGSRSTGFSLTRKGTQLVEDRFEVSKAGEYRAFGLRSGNGERSKTSRFLPLVAIGAVGVVLLLLLVL